VALLAKYCPFHRHTPCKDAISSTETTEHTFNKVYDKTYMNWVVMVNLPKLVPVEYMLSGGRAVK
jgi:hypothetical protein